MTEVILPVNKKLQRSTPWKHHRYMRPLNRKPAGMQVVEDWEATKYRRSTGRSRTNWVGHEGGVGLSGVCVAQLQNSTTSHGWTPIMYLFMSQFYRITSGHLASNEGVRGHWGYNLKQTW